MLPSVLRAIGMIGGRESLINGFNAFEAKGVAGFFAHEFFIK